MKTIIISIFILILLSAVLHAQPTTNGDTVNFEQSARKNSILMNSLRWKWGKDQKGWKVYIPLIQKTLNTTAGADSTEFAESVSVWQSESALNADGILNLETLMSLIDFWQSRRIPEVYEATPEQLLAAPIAQFYDPTRAASLLKVDKEAHAAYLEMLEAARADGVPGLPSRFLKIISAYRSPEYQLELRRRDPSLNGAQLAFRSPHFTGRALDIFVGGDPVSTKDFNRMIQIRTKAYLWLVENAEKFGFFPYFYEPWHWEYVGTTDD